MELRESLTFDDVLLVPAASSVLPAQADTRRPKGWRDIIHIPIAMPRR